MKPRTEVADNDKTQNLGQEVFTGQSLEVRALGTKP